jgi:hypothetical protein
MEDWRLTSRDVSLGEAPGREDVLTPKNVGPESMTVGEPNEEIVATETTLLRRIQSMTLVPVGRAGSVKGIPFSEAQNKY